VFVLNSAAELCQQQSSKLFCCEVFEVCCTASNLQKTLDSAIPKIASLGTWPNLQYSLGTVGQLSINQKSSVEVFEGIVSLSCGLYVKTR